ncbi:alpha-acetolactate decarboxylase [Phialemonium atrogriseum]|uniref:Alpha-acetolactate decarboxylase n=1 Tax=Phialemonium atrogriseum TaxID=1093897 RepID=A0AAJ0BS85_9PEZI|nr:alpha-acetolactate decarboxylase [Phialemonium atrogriseum]KAK1763097.1 alpha-acetolactate decarboxylase [Phialemonium atrogriseum]
MATNELFQYSVVSALMDGVASNGLPVSALLANGDLGLGTFRHMAGEMIVLDGRAHQMKVDGTITPSDPDVDVTPFAMVTRFRPTATVRAALPSKESLAHLLDRLFPRSRNAYVAFRIDGAFRSVTVRTAEGQRFRGEGLAAVGARQVTHTFGGGGGAVVRGAAVGFRSPAFLQGVSVAGVHLHFIAEDGERGGHVLALETDGEVDVGAAALTRVVLELPADDEEFNAARLERDSEGIQAIEG